MAWLRDSITPGELDALREAARRAWGNDTRMARYASVADPAFGQCYVTSRWLVERLGGTVGRAAGHYVWLSSDGAWLIDLAGCGDSTKQQYRENQGHYSACQVVDNERTARFIKRANLIFDNLDSLLKVALDYMGDAYPGEEPQAVEDRGYWHDEPAIDDTSAEYKFVYGNGGLEVSPSHTHTELADHAGMTPAHRGPMATGWIVVNKNKATFEVQTNVSLKALERIFKDYCKNLGWQWGGMTNIEGEPISDEFAPSKSSTLHYAFDGEHLFLGKVSHSELIINSSLANPITGWVRISNGCAHVWPIHVAALEALHEWAGDNDLILYAGNDNVIKRIPDLELENVGADSTELQTAERETSGLYRCPHCDRLFPAWHEYSQHRKKVENEEPEQHGGFPELDPDVASPFQPHFTPLQPDIMPLASLQEAKRVDGFDYGIPTDEFYVAYHLGSPVGYAQLRHGALRDLRVVDEAYRKPLMEKVTRYSGKEPKDLLDQPIPFIYDVYDDKITVGKPGQRSSQIPGKFTPGGILEGVYHPGGKVVVRSMTNVPYTVRHMVQLWYYQYPEYTVKNVMLQDDAGRETKLANEGAAGTIQALVAADPAASRAKTALQTYGGRVFAVGGAVRDALAGRDPKDIDLMVTGIPPREVEALLGGLKGGRVDVTGKDFGVFRFRYHGSEVEIALPRRDRNTGEGHKDFEVQADHTMSPEEDLFRRDFTVNAMAVDLQNGKLVDPYGGQKDLAEGRLRSVRPEALSEDPLRTMRALVARARFGLEPDGTTRQEMTKHAPALAHLPAERIREELDKLFAAPDPEGGIRLAHDTDVLRHFLPEVADCMGYNQNNPHHEQELGEHLLSVLRLASQKTDDPDVRLAALLHDIGKPSSEWVDPVRGTNHFYKKVMDDGTVLGQNHEEVGADMTANLMDRLRYSKERRDRVSDLVRHHMWRAFVSERGARRFLNRVGDHADDLFNIRWADSGGKSVYPSDPTLSLDVQRKLVDRVRNQQQPTTQSQLAINGKDILNLGVQPGPLVGEILRELTRIVIDDPRQNQRDNLLTIAQGYAKIPQA